LHPFLGNEIPRSAAHAHTLTHASSHTPLLECTVFSKGDFSCVTDLRSLCVCEYMRRIMRVCDCVYLCVCVCVCVSVNVYKRHICPCTVVSACPPELPQVPFSSVIYKSPLSLFF